LHDAKQDIYYGSYLFLSSIICEDNFQASLHLANNEDFYCRPCCFLKTTYKLMYVPQSSHEPIA